MAQYKFRIKEFRTRKTANDNLIEIESYLSDLSDIPFITSGGVLDTFVVSLQGSSLPTSGFDEYLKHRAMQFIRDQYTVTFGGTALENKKILTGIETTEDLFSGQSLSGTGIPTDISIESVRDTTSIRMSQAATTSGALTLTAGTKGWDIDFSELVTLASVVDFSML